MLISAFLSAIMKLKTFLEHVDYSCTFEILRFFVFVLVTCPVKATQLMKFITGSEKIPLVGLPAAIIVLSKHDCRLGSNGSHCQCLPVVSTCAIFVKLPVHIITDVQMKDFFEMAIYNEIGFGIAQI